MKLLLPFLLFFIGLQTPTFGLDCQDPEAFEKGLKSVERSMDKGQWEKSSAALLKLLEEHKKADYVFLDKQRVLDDMERISLFMKYDAPSADDVLAGEVKKYDADKGKIEVTFKGSDLSDFLENGGAYTLPVNFAGPYSIEMSGARYPANAPLSIFIGFLTPNEWGISFGSSEYKPSIVWIKEKRDNELLETSEKQPIKMGQPYNLMIEVKNTKVSVKVDKKKLFAMKRTKGDYGRAAFYGLRDYERESLVIKVKGEIEPSWIAGKIDAVMQERLEEFEDMYSAENVLPDWLFDESLASGDSGSSSGSLRRRAGDKGKSSLRPEEASFRDYPGPEMSGYGEGAFEDISEEIFSDDSTFDELIESIDDAVADEELSEVAADFLRMFIMFVYGSVEDALIPGERVAAAAPEHMPSLLVYSRVLQANREFEKGRQILNAAKKRWPNTWDVYEDLIELEVLASDMDAAQDLVRQARTKKLLNRENENFVARVDKAVSGPHWPKTYSFKSKHYVIESDISEAICKEAAALLEGAYTTYSVRLKRVKGLDKNKFRVFLFSGRSGYMKYAGDSTGAKPENSLGMYSPFMKQLLIWNVPERADMMRTIVHEGFHQYLDAVAFDAPDWFHEGMAEYIERIESINGRRTDGQVRHDHLEYLSKTGVMPIASFIRGTSSQFRSGDVSQHYAQSWALIHFLRNTTKKEEAIFDALFNGFVESPSSRQVIADAFEGIDMEELDVQFREYLNKLKNK